MGTSVEVIDGIAVAAPQQILQRTVAALERKIDDAAAGKPAAIDLVLSGVQMIDSAGLNWLLSMQARLETLGTKLRLADLPPIVADVLMATRLDARFTVLAGKGADGGANGG